MRAVLVTWLGLLLTACGAELGPHDGNIGVSGSPQTEIPTVPRATSQMLTDGGVEDGGVTGWTVTGSMATARNIPESALLTNGKVLAAGGFNGSDLASAQLYNPATGTWSTTGPLNAARSHFTMTRLQNGKVLAAGGGLTTSVTQTELYDPATGTWSFTGNLPNGRFDPTATLLPDGKVLLTGGDSFANVEALVYDPATGSWSSAGQPSTARESHTATHLSNGQVLVTGGFRYGVTLSETELYNPATGTWTATGPLNVARSHHTAVLLQNGRVLVTGGYNGAYLASAEIYDPATGTWSLVGSLSTARAFHSANLVAGGRVLISGGSNSAGAVSTSESFDPATARFISLLQMGGGRYGHAAVRLQNGDVLVAGGYSSNLMGSAGRYQEAFSDWTAPTTSLTSPTAGATVSGTVILTAAASDNIGVSRVEFYVGTTLIGSDDTAPYHMSWNSRTVANGSRSLTSRAYDFRNNVRTSASVTVTVDNDLIAPATSLTSPAGGSTLSGAVTLTAAASDNLGVSRVEFYVGTTLIGSDDTAPYSTNWDTMTVPNGNHTLTSKAYDADGNVGTSAGVPVRVVQAIGWTPTGTMGMARDFAEAVALPNGKVLVAGGFNGSPLASSELYDPATGTWSATGPLNAARYHFAMARLQNGKVLAVGGATNTYVLEVELYDPATGIWSYTSSLPNGRVNPTATLLPNGKVLVAGGNAFTNVEALLYDPATGTWSSAGQPSTARADHTATLLANGQVLVAGGSRHGAILGEAELYNPATGTWTATGPLNVVRARHTAVLLQDGRVLVAGGYNGANLSSAEIYDPATGTWSLTGSLSTARGYHSANLLPSGRVLISGGSSAMYNPVSTSEIFDPVTARFTSLQHMGGKREAHIAVQLQNGDVLVASGYGSNFLASAERYREAPPDPVPPTTSLTSPTAGATVSGAVILTAEASDDLGVVRVEFYMGTTLIGSDDTAPYSVIWYTRPLANGSYTLTSKAYDLRDNVSTSASVTVTVDNPPAGAIANEGFEGSAAPWILSGHSYHRSGVGQPFYGTGYNELGGGSSANGSTVQAFQVPTGSPRLRFWLNVTSSESPTIPFDVLYVEVLSSQGNFLAKLGEFSNMDKTSTSQYTEKQFDMSAYAGQSIQLRFRASTDAYMFTTFSIDEVSVW